LTEVLFDLDGTLTDSCEGIGRCIQEALRRLGGNVPPLESLRCFVGPPLQDTFARLLDTRDEALVAEAIRFYRDRFVVTGMFENALYPGVAEGLERLRGGGHRLWVATSKPHVYARRILEHFGVAGAFAGVYGPDLDNRGHDKRVMLREILACERLDPREACMVGDRIHDIEGARVNAIRAVAVTWGYGTAEELRAAAPDHTVETMEELCAYIERESHDDTDPARLPGGSP
jgi:phosphoglycolate phosphatase